MSIAKVSVEKFNSPEQILFEFDKDDTLESNVARICNLVGLPKTYVYGIKYQPTKTCDKNHYLSENNVQDLKHSDCLKIAFSLEFIISRTKMNLKNEDPAMRQIAFDDICKLCEDPVFIEKLGESNGDKVILEVFCNDEGLTPEERVALLRTVVHLFTKGYIQDTTQNILQKAFDILKSFNPLLDEIKFTLLLLQNILVNPNENFTEWKQIIIKNLPLLKLTPYVWQKAQPDLQYASLRLINTLIKISDHQKRRELIKEMNLKQNRENMYHHIIMERNYGKDMEHELYILQFYLLSLFNEGLNSKICIDNNTFFTRDEFELNPNDLRPPTILLDFEEEIGASRYSGFNYEQLQQYPRKPSLPNKDCISHLTLEALRYYRNAHAKNFQQSQIEEQLYEPGIFITSERVVNMLAEMFHIGNATPCEHSTFYQPLVFYCPARTPFLLEIFSHCMWLLSRTRREMKVATGVDYEKVMYILKKQVKSALNTKPKNFKSLAAELSNTTFKSVMENKRISEEKELQVLIDTHPCIQELKQKLLKENEEIVLKQRLGILMNGAPFSRVLEKKLQQRVYIKLSKNKKELQVFDQAHNLKESLLVSDITHIVIGKNCDHANLAPKPDLAFSIIIKIVEEKLKCVAKDEQTACYWTDGLLLLLNQGRPEKLSKYYSEELEQLVAMDVRLQILELQNISIPNAPPPEPPLPQVLIPESVL
ncbi:engulfment and cell motility protein 1-like [Anthonomus grandis grandis]|uniref:engulfment and cell motility protein 1-like n=1 Tax=Anthonomus grandis grandis TaxID=2921223 RepID=UPI002165A97A|nr:engulfment and cell motility protein 1-like [Anthonomus grandis grandis]